MDINIALGIAGAVACLALSGLGSAIGTGFAAAGAIGAWKKCYAQNRPAPFLLLAYVGAPITQTLYGMILMFTMIATITGTFTAESIAALEPERLALLKGLGMTIAENAPSALPFAGMGMLILGIFAGAGIGMSAIFQGRAGGCSADAHGETGQGLTNNLAALGVIETTAIFIMVFTLIASPSFGSCRRAAFLLSFAGVSSPHKAIFSHRL